MDVRTTSGYRDAVNGPYRATQLWNDVIQTFRDQLPCGRHRRIMKTYDNCFSGSSAIDWLYNYLKSSKSFTTDLSREKAVSLVNKIHKAGVFAEVKVSKSMQHKPEVQENRLYRFLPVSPSKSKLTRLPLAPRNDVSVNQCQREKSFVKSKDLEMKLLRPDHKGKDKILKNSKEKKAEAKHSDETVERYPPCYLITKVLTPQEIKQTWERVFTHRLKKTLGMTYHADLINTDAMNGKCVMHNCIYINKNGTVSNIAPEEQFPHWVWSAMKCLARWPEPQEVGLPNYPGFEKDVFIVVKDYFQGLEQPLIPCSLYSAITKVFVCAGNYSSPEDQEHQSVVDSLWASASLENVIMNLAKKYNLLDGMEESCDHEMTMPGKPGQQGEVSVQDAHRVWANDSVSKTSFSQVSDVAKGCLESRQKLCKDEILMTLHPAVKAPDRNFSSCDIKCRPRFTSMKERKFGSMPNLEVSKYETAFGPDNHTVTRVYYQNGVCTDYRHCEEEEDEKGENLVRSSYYPVETHFDIDSGYEAQNVNFERVKSMENINPCARSANSHLSMGFPRSKSFAGGEFLQEIEMRTQSQTDLTSSKAGLHPVANEFLHQNDYATKLSTSSQASWVDSDKLLRKSGTGTALSVSKSGMPNSTKFSRSLSQLSPQWQALPPNRGLALRSRQQNGPRYTGQRSSRAYIDSRARDTPCVEVAKSSPYSAFYSPLDCAGFGPGYKPVLDASKERRNISTGNLSTASCAPRVQRTCSRRVTSTPLSPSCIKNQNCNFGSQQSVISLSNVTPLYQTKSRTNCGTRDYEYVAYPQTRLSEDRAKAYLQLMALLIPPASRRKLQMLFKMMTKMTANPNLCLDQTQSTRSLVLGTFYSAILWPEKEEDSDQLLILQLVSFMLDFHDDIFTPPEDLKKQVSHQLKQMQRPQLSFSPRAATSMHFCQQTTVTEYEQEKKSQSQCAIEELLENIIKDQRMGSKEKRHRLKQFQKTYPVIYSRRFPDPESEARLVPPKPKMKDALIAKPLNRLKGLRL